MNKAVILNRLALSAVLIGAWQASAADPAPRALRIDASTLPQLLQPGPFSSWNGGDPAQVLKPGFKVLFFGSAEGCSADIHGGNVAASSQPPNGEPAAVLTGIAPGGAGLDRFWSPSADTPGCARNTGARSGDSFVQLRADQAQGAIGLYTYSGPRDSASGQRQPAFFGPWGSQGAPRSGANPFIEGSFAGFRQPWNSPEAIQPWSGAAGEAVIRTTQSVQAVQLDSAPAGDNPAQVKQETIVSLINPACMRDGGGQKRPCQIQYLFNTAVYRYGVGDWSQLEWARHAGVFNDPGQNGMTVVHGMLQAPGSVAGDQASGLALYVSAGAATQHQPFAERSFEVRISFANFLNALRVAAAARLHQAPAQLAEEDLAALFGPSWNDPQGWVLLNASVGQEVYNPDRGRRVLLGGSFSSLSVGPS